MTVALRAGAEFLTPAERRAYATGLVLLANDDRYVSAREREVLRAAGRRLRVRLPYEPERFDVDAVARGLKTTSLREAFVHDALLLRGPGEAWSEESLETLKYLCGRWELPLPRLSEVDWEGVRALRETWWEARHKATVAEGREVAIAALTAWSLVQESAFSVVWTGLGWALAVALYVILLNHDAHYQVVEFVLAAPAVAALMLRGAVSPLLLSASSMFSGVVVLGGVRVLLGRFAPLLPGPGWSGLWILVTGVVALGAQAKRR